MLQETNLSKVNFDKTIVKWKKWKSIHVPGIGAFGGLAILWNPLTITTYLIHQDNNWSMMLITTFDISFILINVYGPSSSQYKVDLLENITHFIQVQDPQKTIIGGDFNALLSQEEKIVGVIPPKNLQDFNCSVDNNSLMDIHPRNGSFTWTNKRSGFGHIAAHLDRFLLSHDQKLSYSDITSDILSLLGSDHFPISLTLIQLDKRIDNHFHSSFKFERMWL